MAKSIKPVIDELENMWDYLATNFFQAQYQKQFNSYSSTPLPPFPQRPIITVQARGRKKDTMWFDLNKWTNITNAATAILAGSSTPKLDELVVSTELLKDSATKPADILLEMSKFVALSAATHSGQYKGIVSDNGYWRKMYNSLLGVHLGEGNHGNNKVVGVNTALQTVIDAYQLSNSRAFETMREATPLTKSTSGSSLRKWQCPECKVPLRASRNPRIWCSCGEQVLYAETDSVEFYKNETHVFVDSGDLSCAKCQLVEIPNPQVNHRPSAYRPHIEATTLSYYTPVTINCTKGVL